MASFTDQMSSAGDSQLLRLENQLCFPLYAASRRFTKAYQPYLQELDPDMTYPQYLVLLLLWEHQHMTVKALGENLFLDSGTLTPLLKRMEQKQWLSRRRDPQDERSVIIELLPTGQALKQPACVIPHSLVERLNMTTEEINTARTMLQNLIDKLS